MEKEIIGWKRLRKALRGKDIDAFDTMMNVCRNNASPGSMATRAILTESMFMTILISQQKELMEIKERLERITKKFCQT